MAKVSRMCPGSLTPWQADICEICRTLAGGSHTQIISESNSAWDVATKVVDYLKAGVRQVWVVYPELRQVYIHPDLHSARILTAPAELDGDDLIPGLRLALSELFEDGTEAGEGRA